LANTGLPAGGIVGFVHLLNDAENIAQHDRLLLDPQNFDQSLLLPGQTVSQGYGLSIPAGLAPGSYPLIAGLYLNHTGQRLRRTDGTPDDFLYLTNIDIDNDTQEHK
jgi:hypothetical protein